MFVKLNKVEKRERKKGKKKKHERGEAIWLGSDMCARLLHDLSSESIFSALSGRLRCAKWFG